MKLSLDEAGEVEEGEEAEGRPETLTASYFATLMITEAKKKGVFQMVGFRRKRDLDFSTKISDGYFEVKVMMVQEAARQLERGEIQANSIL